MKQATDNSNPAQLPPTFELRDPSTAHGLELLLEEIRCARRDLFGAAATTETLADIGCLKESVGDPDGALQNMINRTPDALLAVVAAVHSASEYISRVEDALITARETHRLTQPQA